MPRVSESRRKLFSELRELHDLALAQSLLEGRRRSIGRVSMGKTVALWRSGEGGDTWLTETGVRLGEVFPTILPRALPPSRLAIYGEAPEDSEDELVELTEFSMDLSPSSGFVEVRRTMFDRLSLTRPDIEDLSLLRAELERGASGAYALRDIYDNEIE